ncbi:DUF6009 family protein [Streptomyces sp. NPDC055254]
MLSQPTGTSATSHRQRRGAAATGSPSHESDLLHESSVGLENPRRPRYVRQALDETAQRRGKPRYPRDGLTA